LHGNELEYDIYIYLKIYEWFKMMEILVKKPCALTHMVHGTRNKAWKLRGKIMCVDAHGMR
jgi:hypothetical protein